MPQTRSRPGRRGLLIAGASLALASGCTLNNPFDSTKTPAVDAIDNLAPDVALAVTAVGALLEAEAQAQVLITSFPGLRGRVAGLVALHAAHLGALQEAVPSGVDPAPQASAPPPPSTRAAALKQQHSAELVLHDRLVGLALRAQSGPFARLLGSMSAAIAQQLAAAPLVETAR